LLYVTDTFGDIPSRKFEHLSCFYPGLLALGVRSFVSDTSVPDYDKLLHRWAAEGLAHTCWTMYGESASGLAPEEAQFASAHLIGVPKTTTFKERWMNHVRIWEAEGGLRGKPPGVARLAELVMKDTGINRDYTTRVGQYLLRPEVCHFIVWLPFLYLFPCRLSSQYI
jgi:mannosyl-oligosaccharide alpha-1,2-mannosidase